MWPSPLCIAFFFPSLVSAITLPTSPANSTCDQQCQIDKTLGPELSKNASIVHTTAAIPRWSEFDAPNPGTVVNVASELDVLLTVRYCVARNLSFLAQNGGTGWTTTFAIGQNDVLINLRGIRQINFNADKTQVTFQGGAMVKEIVDAAYANGAQVLTANCNCVGALGAVLGGGYSRFMGLYGFGVDNVLSMSLVTAFGTVVEVRPKDTDLWWALRGAGANFGIVTTVTMKSYPVPTAQNGAWLGALIFTEDKLEALVQAVNNLNLLPPMAIFLNFATLPPNNTATIIAIPFYLGNETQGRAAFSSILAIGPIADETTWTPYNLVNAGSDSFCVRGGRKPSYGVGLAQMDPATWRSIWNEYNSFLQIPGTQNSTVLVECYSLYKATSFGLSSSSYAFRSSIKFSALVVAWYADPALDSKAEAFGSTVRDLWRSTDNLPSNETYINFANGDESLEAIYGGNVARLQKIKREYDPHGRFNQYFPLT